MGDQWAARAGGLLVRNPQAAGPFSPLSLPSPVIWGDPSDAASITSSGGLVSQINDKTTNARHLTSTGTARPIISGAGSHTINSLAALTFDGSNSFMSNTIFAYPSVNTFTLWIVLVVNSAANDRIVSMSSASQDYDGADRVAMLSTDGTNHYTYYNNGFVGTVARVTGTAVQLTIQRNGATFSIWKNGSAGTGSSSSVTTNFAATRFALGGFLNGSGGVQAQFNGWSGEFFMDSTAVGTSDRQSGEAYLKAKWGTP